MQLTFYLKLSYIINFLYKFCYFRNIHLKRLENFLKIFIDFFNYESKTSNLLISIKYSHLLLLDYFQSENINTLEMSSYISAQNNNCSAPSSRNSAELSPALTSSCRDELRKQIPMSIPARENYV